MKKKPPVFRFPEPKAKAEIDNLFWHNGGDAEMNARALLDMLKGKKSALRDIGLFNAAAALIVAGRAKDLKDGMTIAMKSVDSGEAEGRLDRLIAVSNSKVDVLDER